MNKKIIYAVTTSSLLLMTSYIPVSALAQAGWEPSKLAEMAGEGAKILKGDIGPVATEIVETAKEQIHTSLSKLEMISSNKKADKSMLTEWQAISGEIHGYATGSFASAQTAAKSYIEQSGGNWEQRSKYLLALSSDYENFTDQVMSIGDSIVGCTNGINFMRDDLLTTIYEFEDNAINIVNEHTQISSSLTELSEGFNIRGIRGQSKHSILTQLDRLERWAQNLEGSLKDEESRLDTIFKDSKPGAGEIGKHCSSQVMTAAIIYGGYKYVEPETKERVWDFISAGDKNREEYKKFYENINILKKQIINRSAKVAVLQLNSTLQKISEMREHLR